MIYVDEHCHRSENLFHVVADSTEELLEVRNYLLASFPLGQVELEIHYPRTKNEHFDAPQSYRGELERKFPLEILSNRTMRAFTKGRKIPRMTSNERDPETILPSIY